MSRSEVGRLSSQAMTAPATTPMNWFNNGYEHARCHKLSRESQKWTFTGTEKGEDGRWYAVLTREEVNSYNDVMNGTGTGLGTHTVTERVKLT